MDIQQMEGDGPQDPPGVAGGDAGGLVFSDPNAVGGMFDERTRADSLLLRRVQTAFAFVQLCEHKEGIRFADMGGSGEESAYQGLNVEVQATERDALEFLSAYFKGEAKPDYSQ